MIFVDTHDSNWAWDETAGAYYWHRFFDHQPDLNFDDAWVREAMKDVVRFWLDAGFDGLRLDAVPYLYEREGTDGENLPETHAYLKELRAMVDAEYTDRVLLAEANQWPDDVAAYFGDGDEFHMAFHFPVMPRLFMAVALGEAKPVIDILDRTPDLPSGCQWGIFLRNHDELTLEMVTPEERAYMYGRYAPEPSMRKNLGIRRRLAPLLDGDRRKITLLNGLLLSLPGSPFLYYGDEIGMGDDHLLEDRDGVRTPMQWEDSRGVGFSSADVSVYYLPPVSDPDYDPVRVNVSSQRDEPSSLLSWVRDLLAVRRSHPTLGTGNFIDHPVADPAAFCFTRRGIDGAVLVTANFSDGDVSVVPNVAERHWVDVASSRPGWSADEPLDLGPYEFRWLVPVS